MPSTPSLYCSFKHPRDIRLLRIQHKKKSERIEIDFDHFGLDTGVQYTALSYVWGNPSPPSWVTCNDRHVPVTRNLWEVLSCLQETGFNGWLWVDAICINQQDDKEKGIQVSMMRDIYKQAAKVIFWLGKQEQFDNEAVHLINVFIRKHEINSDIGHLRSKSLTDVGLPVTHRGWAGWASLISRPWFGRVWVVQEFLNASRSVFMSGALEIPSERFVWFAFATGACAAIGETLAMNSADISKDRDLILRAFAFGLDNHVREIESTMDTRLVDLWTKSQLLEATDPRDRVFALLSTQTAVSMEIVDYKKDLVAVYTEITSLALTLPVAHTDWYSSTLHNPSRSPLIGTKERTSRFLACKTTTPHPPGLPSWVPDWRPVGFRFVPLTRYYPGTAWFAHDYSHAIISGKVMAISGYTVDRPSIIVDSMSIAGLRNPYLATDLLDKMFKAALNWQIMCYLLARRYSRHREAFLEVFCRTMAFNSLRLRLAVPGSEYIAGFQSLHRKLATGMKYRLEFPETRNPDSSVIFESLFCELTAGRKFAITRSGDLAWVPETTTLDDQICFLAGSAVPFVIRSVGESFKLLGDCYLHSRMSNGNITITDRPRLMHFR